MRHKKRLFIGLCSLLSFIGIGIYLNDFRIQTDSVAKKTDKGAPGFVSESQTTSALPPTGEPAPLSATSEHHKNHIGCEHPIHSKASNEQASPSSPRPSLDLPKDFLASFDRVEVGANVSFPLPGGLSARGVLTAKRVDIYGYPLSIEGVLEQPGLGHFSFQKENAPGKAWPLSGIVIIKDDTLAYRAEPHPSKAGSAHLVAYSIEEVLCYRFPSLPAEPLEAPITATALPADHPTNIPIPDYQNGVIPLQSLPAATAVLYLDFDGEEGPHQNWGDFDALPSGDLSVANIFGIWRRVAEDFAPFNLNVTTDLQIYLDAPENSRQRIIVTPTRTAVSGAAGVAFVGSFNWSGDVPAWAFYQSGKSAAEVISHELGHTLGLGHDGRNSPSEGYYGGHGSGDVGWASIMGVGYYKNLSQWSKGEYASANNTEDDLQIITDNNNVAYRTDDHGNTQAAANFLEIFEDDSVKNNGVISTSADVDVFSFSTTGGQSNLNINPESTGPNLDLLAQLYNDQGTLLQSSNPDTAINATISANLAAGDYTLHISGVGRGDPLGDGYTDYASLGVYAITGTVVGGLESLRFEIDENPANGAVIDTVTPRNNHGSDSLNYAISAGNDSNAFAINSSSGSLSVADPAQFNYESLSSGFNKPAEFELTVTITNATRPALNESHRVIITVTDVNEAPVITGGAAFIPEGLRVGTSVFQLSLNDPDHYDTHTWTITSGNTGGVFAIDNQGLLTVASPPDFNDATSYTLQIKAVDSATTALSDTTTLSVDILNVIPSGYNPGIIYHTNYLNIEGNNLDNLTSHAKFPYNPDSEKSLSTWEKESFGDRYGTTVRAYLIAPYTGDYNFWLSGDDAGQLLLSTDEDPGNASTIASHGSWTNSKQWDKFSSQKSSTVSLTAGEVYYIESRLKENNGGDHFAVSWEVVSGSTTHISQEVIPATFLAPHTLNYAPILADLTAISVPENTFPNKILKTIQATELNTNQTLSYSISGGDTAKIFTIDPQSGELSLSAYAKLDAATTPFYSLSITATDNGAPNRSTTKELTINITDEHLITDQKPIFEKWTGISGTDLQQLYDDPDWPENPDSIKILNQLDTGQHLGDDYGGTIKAYLVPPTTGEYTLYVASDDRSLLRLSTDTDPTNAINIAHMSEDYTNHSQWEKYTTQKSNPINLTSGNRYYIEARIKEGHGGDHLEVGWTGPGISSITLIPETNLQRYDSNTPPVFASSSYTFNLNNNATNGTVVGSVSASSQTFESIHYAIISGNTGDAFNIHTETGQITLKDATALTPGQVFNLSIGAQDDGYSGNLPLKSSFTSVTISVSGTSYQIWKGQHFGNDINNTQITGNSMDPDKDSINNLIEYALNLDPNKKDSANNLPTVSKDSSALKFTYRKNLSATDLTYNIQQATDLLATTPWSAAQITNEETLSDDGSTRIIRATLSNPAPNHTRFIRLQVEID